MEAEHEDRAQERALRDRRLLHVRAAADRDADGPYRRVDRDRPAASSASRSTISLAPSASAIALAPRIDSIPAGRRRASAERAEPGLKHTHTRGLARAPADRGALAAVLGHAHEAQHVVAAVALRKVGDDARRTVGVPS